MSIGGGLRVADRADPFGPLIWIASMLCIATSFGMSYLLIGDLSVELPDNSVMALPKLPAGWNNANATIATKDDASRKR